MKTQLAVFTFALIIGLSGITPTVAGSPSTSTHSSASTHSSSQSAPYGRGNEFTRSWDEQRTIRPWNQETTPSRSEGSQSSSARPTIGKSCSLGPRFGFNDASNFPTC